MPTESINGVVLGLDIGESRIGVARAHSIARLPEPLLVIDLKKQDAVETIIGAIKDTNAELLVVGLPLLTSGDDSLQTSKIREFMNNLLKFTIVPFVYIDEAYSSQEADEYIKRTGLALTSNDAVAACIILERYFERKEN